MIYVNDRVRTATLSVPVEPVPGTLEVFVHSQDAPVYEVGTVVNTEGELSFTMPFFLCQDERDLVIEWKFNYVEGGKTYTYENYTVERVVTPILSRKEILRIHPNATEYEVVRIEQAVRHIINAHTGQTFGRFIGTHKVKGTGTRFLHLPARLIEIRRVDGEAFTGPEDDPDLQVPISKYFVITDGGWALQHFPWGVPPVKADYYGLHQHTGGVIHNPNHVRLGDFAKSRTFAIEGVWGWDKVPDQVEEAARLLVNDYACADAAYRDRYLTSMTAADWRIQFNDGAFAKTGNVRADQLLSDYVLKQGWVVI